MIRTATAAPGRCRATAVTAAQGGLLGSALAKAEAWLLEPLDDELPLALPLPAGPRPVVAVFGLAPACGATVVARALAAELAARDHTGAAAVSSAVPSGAVPLASAGAGRLARALADVPGATTRALGRLCLVHGADPLRLADTARHLAPLALDAGDTPVGGVPASIADRVVLVALPRVEPSLAAVAAGCIARVGPDPVVALNRAREPGAWSGRAAVTLPDSRMGARLALSGREARGELGRAIAELADLCGGAP